MASSAFFTLLDDIATLLDDVAAMSKIATKKTASVLSDDLAVNAEQVSGISAARELPVIYQVFKGSLLNKLILVPVALLVSIFAPWAIVPALLLGAVYLCYEGFEKVVDKIQDTRERDEAHHKELVEVVKNKAVDIVSYEKAKIKGAVRTDFILSAEIIVITLGVIAAASIMKQVIVLSLIALLVTVVVYGLVAAIVKIDDAGLYLEKTNSRAAQVVGGWLLWSMPYLMKGLSLFGTVAMFLVGGGIVSHNVEWVHHLLENWSLNTGVASIAADMLIGGIVGAVAVLIHHVIHMLRHKKEKKEIKETLTQ